MIIYLVTNLINGKLYVGQTTRTLKKRWKEHCSKTSKCPCLHNAIEKYGKENFKVEQIDIAIDRKELDKKEQYYINFYNTLAPNGYNLETGGNLGAQHSEETLEKMKAWHREHPISDIEKDKRVKRLSEYWKGNTRSKESIEKSAKSKWKPVSQYTKQGEFVRTWNSAKEASETLHIHKSTLCQCCKGVKPSAGGYVWKYAN